MKTNFKELFLDGLLYCLTIVTGLLLGVTPIILILFGVYVILVLIVPYLLILFERFEFSCFDFLLAENVLIGGAIVYAVLGIGFSISLFHEHCVLAFMTSHLPRVFFLVGRKLYCLKCSA